MRIRLVHRRWPGGVPRLKTTVAYASYRTIARFGTPEDGTVGGLWFNKVMSLLNERLRKEHRIRLDLPHCWYFWGDRVVLEEMPGELQLETPDRLDGMHSQFRWVGARPKDPPPRERKAINSLVDSIRSLYPQSDASMWRIVQDVYRYAPYDFQRSYASFRTDFFETVEAGLVKLKSTILKNGLNKAFREFPHDDFPELAVEAATVRLIADAMLAEGSARAQRDAMAVAKDFWEMFCRVLITTPRGHDNLSVGIIEKWKQSAITQLPEYDRGLHHEVDIALARYNLRNISKDTVVRAFLQPEDWGKGTEDSSVDVNLSAYSRG